MITEVEFMDKKCELGYSDRISRMGLVLGKHKNLINERTKVNSVYECDEFFKEQVKQGLEGAIIKSPDGLYEFRRTSSWMKMKPEEPYDVRIIGYQQGRGKHKGVLGAFICEFDGEEGTTKVGSGFSDEERKDFWVTRNSMIGKILEIQGQEITKNNSVRHPRFIKLRNDKDETSKV